MKNHMEKTAVVETKSGSRSRLNKQSIPGLLAMATVSFQFFVMVWAVLYSVNLGLRVY